MNFQKLFAMQKGLDEHIQSNHQLQNEDLFDRKVLALLVELGELANETRCFKFWSLKSPSPRNVILEEFVDGIHFILSLGLELGFDQESDFSADVPVQESISGQFLAVFEQISRFRASRAQKDYQLLFQTYLDLGQQLGFSAEDIEKAYMEKNDVNYKRQEQGY